MKRRDGLIFHCAKISSFSVLSIVMTDLEFMDHAEQLLLAVERSCDRINDTTDADVDAQRSGGMVTLTFPNRSQIVINLDRKSVV